MLGLLLATTALHAEERRASRGERLALEGRCGVAIPELERELEVAPDPGRIAWRLGQCLLRERRYEEAVVQLERAAAAEPSRTEVQLDLARARYHLRDLAGADAALHASEADFGEEAIWNLYRGMVDLERGDPAAAAVALERAVEINQSGFRTRADLQAVEPVASYYLGVALRQAGEEERAIETLSEVADTWTGTQWAGEAARVVGKSRPRRSWMTLGTGVEYDDNVVLSGRDTPLPSEISDEEGFRSVWNAHGILDLGRWGRNAAGVQVDYRGRAHYDHELHEFDTHLPRASLWFDRALRGDTHLRLNYDVGHAWVHADPYALNNAGRLSLIRAWSSRQNSALGGSFYVDDYRNASSNVPDGPGTPGAPCTSPTDVVCGPPGLDERRARNRDGWGATGFLTHAWSPESLELGSLDPSFYGGYRYNAFDSEGREYSEQSHRFHLGVRFSLPRGVALQLDGSYEGRVYRHASTFPNQRDLMARRQYFLSDLRRREHLYAAGGRLWVPITRALSAVASYRYRDSRSTSDVFDYDQHILGILLNVTLLRSS